MAFHNEKDLKSKILGEKSLYLYYLNLKSKPITFGLKNAYVWCTLIQALKSKCFFFNKMVTKYSLPEKISLLISLQAEIKGGGGGGGLKGPPPTSFVWQKAQPFKG